MRVPCAWGQPTEEGQPAVWLGGWHTPLPPGSGLLSLPCWSCPAPVILPQSLFPGAPPVPCAGAPARSRGDQIRDGPGRHPPRALPPCLRACGGAAVPALLVPRSSPPGGGHQIVLCWNRPCRSPGWIRSAGGSGLGELARGRTQTRRRRLGAGGGARGKRPAMVVACWRTASCSVEPAHRCAAAGRGAGKLGPRRGAVPPGRHRVTGVTTAAGRPASHRAGARASFAAGAPFCPAPMQSQPPRRRPLQSRWGGHARRARMHGLPDPGTQLYTHARTTPNARLVRRRSGVQVTAGLLRAARRPREPHRRACPPQRTRDAPGRVWRARVHVLSGDRIAPRDSGAVPAP